MGTTKNTGQSSTSKSGVSSSKGKDKTKGKRHLRVITRSNHKSKSNNPHKKKEEGAYTIFMENEKKMIAVFLVLILVGTGFAVAFHYVDDSENGGEVEKSKYVQSIELGGEWFLNNQDESFLYYEYNFYGKNHSSSHHSLREMGALWSISMLDNFLDDDRYAELARKGFSHFEEHFVHDQENDFLYVNITSTKIKLGYSAFIILSLLNMEHEQKEYYLTQFANGIVYQQNPDGSFNTFFYSDDTTGVDYYPGESLFALMSLYAYTGDPSYLEAAEKAFPFYTEYWRNDPNTAFIAWQTRAYYYLYQATGKLEYADFVIEMNDYLVDEYDPGENCTGFSLSTRARIPPF